MKHLSLLIKPASSRCNMRCLYCFYSDVSARREVPCHGIMTADVMDGIIGSVYQDLSDGDRLSVAFQGGEPSLAGLPYFEAFAARAASANGRVKTDWSIQTNGLLVDEKWAAFLKHHDFLVGLSLDGTGVLHDAVRLDEGGQGTHQRVSRTRRLLNAYGVRVNILAVLTRQMAARPDEVMDELIREGMDHVQFIPCLGPLTGDPGDHALTPDLFASFYDGVFRRWLKELRRGHLFNIQFIDALIEMIAGGRETVCGLKGECRAQMVVESDGSVYPCDFYVLDGYRMGDLTAEPLSALQDAPGGRRFLSEKPALPAFCRSCSCFSLCGGGCRRLKGAVYLDEAEGACGYRLFLEQHYPSLRFIARQLI